MTEIEVYSKIKNANERQPSFWESFMEIRLLNSYFVFISLLNDLWIQIDCDLIFMFRKSKISLQSTPKLV